MGGTTTTYNDPPSGNPPPCPLRLTAILPNTGGVAQGDKLGVVLEPGPPTRAVLVTSGGQVLGAVAGVAQLGRFLDCLREGVSYSAHVENLTPAALTCTIVRAGG